MSTKLYLVPGLTLEAYFMLKNVICIVGKGYFASVNLISRNSFPAALFWMYIVDTTCIVPSHHHPNWTWRPQCLFPDDLVERNEISMGNGESLHWMYFTVMSKTIGTLWSNQMFMTFDNVIDNTHISHISQHNFIQTCERDIANVVKQKLSIGN